MIVEFIGTTGAGKTTIISLVRQRLERTHPVTTPFDLVAGRLGLEGLTHPTVRNILQELVGFPFFLAALNRHSAFVAFMLRMYARQARVSIFFVNNLRSLERKIGAFEIVRRRQEDGFVLVDEGTVLASHNVFVYSNTHYGDEEIATFASVVPLPDIIIYITASEDVLVERALQRPDPPRELRSREPGLVRTQVRRATAMFEHLVGDERLRSRVLVVENSSNDRQQAESAADEIVNFIFAAEQATRNTEDRPLPKVPIRK